MRSSPLIAALALVLGLLAASAPAEPRRSEPGPVAEAAPYDGEPRLLARLLAHPLGEGAWQVGVELVPDPGWHVYWRNPGDTGLAPRIHWQAPGARFGAIAWPAPLAFRDAADLVSYGYEGPVLLAANAELPRDASELTAEVEALVCAEVCLPASFRLRRDLDAGADSDTAIRARFEAAAHRVPRAAEALGLRVELEALDPEGDTLRARLLVDPCADTADRTTCIGSLPSDPSLAFFPYLSSDIDWRAGPALPDATEPGRFRVELRGESLETPPAASWPLAGVLPLQDARGAALPVEISVAPRSQQSEAGVSAWAWLRAALLGWIGGLILNLMPCVLPVLAIKLAALASLAGSSRRAHVLLAAAYAGGIAASMLALAAVVLGMRVAGTAVGWGFQLQEPVFLLAISCLLVAFAANLFGVFEIELDTSRLGRLGNDSSGAARSFFDGLLAVALATPCSAPFLGTAVGFAFASPAPVIVSIFLAIGLGLATPFLLAAVFPGWARRMPRSGAWMADLRVVLGFALLLTVVWLLWILGRSAGPGALSGALLLLLAVAVFAWGLGLLQRRGRPLSAPWIGVALVGIAFAGIGQIDVTPRSDVAAATPVIDAARPFASEQVRHSLAAGRPVFVYFTADWCVTCKVNERGALASPQLAAELERLGFDVYRGDWTRRDERIRSALAELGKAGVPVYAVYSPESPDEPRLLPELLTLDTLLDALREAAGRDTGPARDVPPQSPIRS